MYRNTNTTRLRCGSVERSRDPAPYRTSYGRQEPTTSTIADRGRSTTSTNSTSRMSRATSYDPFSTSTNRTRTDYSTYTPRSTTTSSSSSTTSLTKSRYGSTEQLTNSYKPPSYRSSTSSTTSSYTPRNVRAGSVTVGGAYDSPRIDSSLSRYRPVETPSYTSTLSKYRSTDKLASKYCTYRSPENSVYNTSTSSSRSSLRFSKSMSREKSEEEEEEVEEDEVEKTFKKLYQKYVTDSEDTESDTESTKSLAERVTEKLEGGPLKRTSSASSITPRASVANSPNMTPKCSPLVQRKIIVPASSSESESESESEVEPEPEPEPSAPVKIATSIRINGKQLQENFDTPKTSTIKPVRIKIRSKTPEMSKEKERSTEKSESPPSDGSSGTGSIRRRRDPNRTLENLKSILDSEKSKMKETAESPAKLEDVELPKPDDQVAVEPPTIEAPASSDTSITRTKPRAIPIPLVLITAPSGPNTPMATTPVNTTASICLWNKESARKSTSSEEDEEYEDEEVYSSGDWTSAEEDEEEDEAEEEYGSSDCEFSVSQTFSLKGHLPFGEMFPLAESTSTASAKVSEFDLTESYLTKTRKEESRGRVDSLFAVPAPTFTCSVSYDDQEEDEDEDENWLDDVHSCDEGDDDDFRVVPICDTLRPTSSSLAGYMSPPGSMTSEESYDGRTVGCTLKLLDRAAAKDSEEDSEYYEDEEYEEDEEEYWDEEYEEEEIEEEEEEIEEEEEEILEEYYEDEEEEVSCESAEDLSGEEDEEEEEEESVSGDQISQLEEIEMEEAVFEEMKPIQFDVMTVSQVEEMIEEASCAQIPEILSNQIDQIEVENYIENNKDVNLVPTFVRQMTENVKEEMTSRFASERKPATDFAKKAVIQPAKLEKVKVGEQIQTKIGEQPKPKLIEKVVVEREDKSAIRKSALNMKEEDAKKKAVADEKAAQQKARRFGTVSAISGKFNEEQNDEISYKKSSRLEPVEKPKRTYEVVKPVISDDFDKQMKELREKMKDGQNKLQTKMKDLSKGIQIDSEDAKNREMSEKRRITNEKTSGTIGKVEEEKARFRAARDASVDRIEAEKHLRKKKILIDVKNEEEKKPEPKRTIRRWKPPPPDPNAIIPSFSSGPPASKPLNVAQEPITTTTTTSKPSTPTSIRKKIPISQVRTESPIQASPPSSNGAVATRIRNNGTPTSAEKRYSNRRKTQEIVNESVLKPKQNRRKIQPRKKRFIRPDRDVDLLLGFQLNATFEQLEKLFEIASFDKISKKMFDSKMPKRRPPTKTFISNLTDIDKIYKASEIRDIIASVNLVY